MSGKTSIEWTDKTWNPVTGCDKVSPGCANCYAERFAERWRGIPDHPFEQGFDVKLWPGRLKLPRSWRKPARIFVNSMSDMFHEKVSYEFWRAVVGVMTDCPQHTFQILTKRPERMLEFTEGCPPTPNVWLGVSVENQKAADERIPLLLRTPAAVRFLSCEPLLGPIDLQTYLGKLPEDDDGAPYPGKIDWVIVGGESGPRCRPMNVAWAQDIQMACQETDTPFFMKQLGGHPNKRGKVDDLPAGLACREFPGEVL